MAYSFNTQEISQEEFERIESYLLDKLSEEEKKAFEEAMEKSPNLSEKVEEVRNILMGVQAEVLKGKLELFHQGLDKKPGQSRPLFPLKYLMAAAVALLILAFLWNSFETAPKEKQLFSQYFEADPGLISRMGQESNYAFNKAMVEYKSGNYAAAIKSWQELQLQKNDNDSLNYYLGVAHLANQSEESAIPFLLALEAQGDSPFYNEALWYLALAYIKQGKKELAKATLAKTQHDKKDELLEKLKK